MTTRAQATPTAIWIAATVLVGLVAGLGGMALGMMLHFVQHHAYGYSLHALVGTESFLDGVSAASPERRLFVLSFCGLVAGAGWWAIRRFGSPLVSIAKAVSSGQRMPFFSTVAHDVLQIVTVALGSPLGREVAPRELGALLAGAVSRRFGLTKEEQRLLTACGAGAGLAAVYNVPLGGALFTLEVLLTTFDLAALLPALATSVIAAVVAWMGLGNQASYELPRLSVNSSLIAWSIVAGPVFGVAAHYFVQMTQSATKRAAKNWRQIPWSLATFASIGIVAMKFPQLLGNGKGIGYLAFNSDLTLKLACVLLLLRLFVILASLRAGAAGGLLTPGLTLGCLIAVVLGTIWTGIWPGVTVGAFAIVGGAAFLASSMKMPLTAIALVMEFTHVDESFLVPIAFAVVGSVFVSQSCGRHAHISLPDTVSLNVPQEGVTVTIE